MTMINLLKKLLKNNADTILEIGAHKGTETKQFLNEFPSSKIFCFEPDPRIVKLHQSYINDPRCQLFPLAISDENGTATFYQSGGQDNIGPQHNASSSLRKPKEHLTVYDHIKFESEVKVETMKLDDWSDQHNISAVDLIWADVQGAEDLLIKGGRKTLSKTKYFFTEFDNREMYENQKNLQELKKLLPSFEVICLYYKNVLFKNMEIEASPVKLISERIMTNLYIYQNEKTAFHFPLNTGLRKFLPK